MVESDTPRPLHWQYFDELHEASSDDEQCWEMVAERMARELAAAEKRVEEAYDECAKRVSLLCSERAAELRTRLNSNKSRWRADEASYLRDFLRIRLLYSRAAISSSTAGEGKPSQSDKVQRSE